MSDYKTGPVEAARLVVAAYEAKVDHYEKAVAEVTKLQSQMRKNSATRHEVQGSIDSLKKHLEFARSQLEAYKKVSERVEELMAIQDQIDTLVSQRREMFPGVISPEITIRSAMRNGFVSGT